MLISFSAVILLNDIFGRIFCNANKGVFFVCFAKKAVFAVEIRCLCLLIILNIPACRQNMGSVYYGLPKSERSPPPVKSEITEIETTETAAPVII